MTEKATSGWRKAHRSGSASDNCVEVAHMDGGVIAVRDSKDPSGPILRFGSADWYQFIGDIPQADQSR